MAVLSANYVAARLGEHFPVLYRGESGLVAHECILDLRDVTRRTGVTVDDVAKRLVDYGFHAPTMSFPVAGTLMVEPTESEDLDEIDRFCDAMIAIKREIDRVEAGDWTVAASPLRGAPHTARVLVGDWDRAYSREEAVCPAGFDPDKYWPPVAPGRPGLRRPPPGLLLPAGRHLRLMANGEATQRYDDCLAQLQADGRLPSVTAAVVPRRRAGLGGRRSAPTRRRAYRIGSITKIDDRGAGAAGA